MNHAEINVTATPTSNPSQCASSEVSIPVKSEKLKQRRAKKPYKCMVKGVKCKSGFSTQEMLDMHIRKHDPNYKPSQDSPLYNCNLCSKVFINTAKLHSHQLVHTEDRPYKCKFCDVRCKKRGILKEHYKIHKGLIFKCSICGKDFNKIGNLNTHEKKHFAREKHFKCSICPKEFTQKCLLKYHMETHLGMKPHQCTECPAAFQDKSNLRKHYRIHTGEKPFKCDVCGKQFNQNSSLTCHKRTHVTYKAFSCKYCSKLFGQNDELTVHLRIHGEVKPFKCATCDSEFMEHAHYKSHLRLHIELKPKCMNRTNVYKFDVDLNDERYYTSDLPQTHTEKPIEKHIKADTPITDENNQPEEASIREIETEENRTSPMILKVESVSEEVFGEYRPPEFAIFKEENVYQGSDDEQFFGDDNYSDVEDCKSDIDDNKPLQTILANITDMNEQVC